MRDINLLHPEVKAKALEHQALAKSKLGLDIIITQTLRTNEEQVAYYAQGRNPVTETNRLRSRAGMSPIGEAENRKKVTNAATAADSFHGYGLAYDIAVVDPTGKKIDWNKPDWNFNSVNDWNEVGKLAAELGIEWGGTWQSFTDIPHYQYTLGWTINRLKSAGMPPGQIVTRAF